jgi:hypothetical protein
MAATKLEFEVEVIVTVKMNTTSLSQEERSPGPSTKYMAF